VLQKCNGNGDYLQKWEWWKNGGKLAFAFRKSEDLLPFFSDLGPWHDLVVAV